MTRWFIPNMPPEIVALSNQRCTDLKKKKKRNCTLQRHNWYCDLSFRKIREICQLSSAGWKTTNRVMRLSSVMMYKNWANRWVLISCRHNAPPPPHADILREKKNGFINEKLHTTFMSVYKRKTKTNPAHFADLLFSPRNAVTSRPTALRKRNSPNYYYPLSLLPALDKEKKNNFNNNYSPLL